MANVEGEHPTTFSYDMVPSWEKDMLVELGFEGIEPPYLRRVNYDKNTYNVYSDKNTCEPMVAESVYAAIGSGQLKTPFKIVNTHSRIPDIISSDGLEFAQEGEEQAAEGDAAAEDKSEIPDAPTEEKPAE